MPVNFSIEDIRILSSHYSINPISSKEGEKQTSEPKDNAEGIQVETTLQCNTHYEEKERSLKVILRCIIGGAPGPYSLEVEMGGAFKLDSDPSEEELDSLRHINCPAMIFPYLREYVSELTKRAGYAPLYLPPVNFVKAHKENKS